MVVQVIKQRCSVWGNEYGDGRAWYRGPMLGRGNSGCVFLALKHREEEEDDNYPSQMAVKSVDLSFSRSLRDEATVLSNIGSCPYIITCFGSETTMGEHAIMYNLLLEYAAGGTLADKINKSGGVGLPESEAKVYAWSILKGLDHIHGSGYVHCDLKPENILLVANEEGGFTAKIGDFGFAKKAEENNKKRKFQQPCWRGTLNYLPPEAVIYGLQMPRSDIWALGCIVLEMLTGKPAWRQTDNKELSDEELVSKIRAKGELPDIPNEISEEAKRFLKICLTRSPLHRSDAKHLLHHSFFEGFNDDIGIQVLDDRVEGSNRNLD